MKAVVPGLVLLAVLSTGAYGVTPAVSAGYNHTLALHSDGTVKAWGDDSAGELGVGRSLTSSTPVQVGGLSGVTALSGGAFHVLALRNDGTVWAWGLNSSGQLGDDTTETRSAPVQVKNLSGVIRISAGFYHSVALKSDGTVWTWGYNFTGQLGDGTTTYRYAPVRVPALTGVVAISGGGSGGNDGHTLAVKSDGTVWAWGSNGSGQLGDGTTTQRLSPVQVASLSNVSEVEAGYLHSLALRRDGTVWAWGDNRTGQLGDGTATNRSTPVQVAGLGSVTAISAGGSGAGSDGHSIALRSDGTVWGWGADSLGQLGDGSPGIRFSPVQAVGLSGVTQISTGFSNSAALKGDGTLWSWGSNSFGQVGDGTTSTRSIPVRVTALNGVTAMALGRSFALAATSDGRVWAWGTNNYGQLGDAGSTFRVVPITVSGLANVTAISAGSFFSAALKSDGTVVAWGGNGSGQLGNGTTNNSPTPVPTLGLYGVAAISAGDSHLLALVSDGRLWAWGSDYYGQLGQGNMRTFRTSPGPVSGMTNVVAISAGSGFSMAVKSDGTVWAWGRNEFGELGDGTTSDRAVPASVAGLTDVVAVAAGSTHVLALRRDGTVYGWGRNFGGEVGDGTTQMRLTPRPVSGLSDVTAIAAGSNVSMALRRDGTLWTWGIGIDGVLGSGSTSSRSTPAQVTGIPAIASMDAGGLYHAVARQSDGGVLAWGNNYRGAVGDGTLATRSTPTVVRREDGAGRIATGDWFLDLDPAAATTVAAERTPAFLVATEAVGSTVTANVQFRAQDTGREIRVFAYAPSPSAAKSGHTCTLAQLSSSGTLQSTTAAGLQAIGNVTGSLSQSVTVLNNFSSSQVAGATFCVGTGSGTEAVSTANSQCVVTVPGTNVCLPPSSGSGGTPGVTANLPGALSGLWWSANESGWGIHFTQRSSNIFAAWYTYDAAGNPKWYVASNCTGASATSGTCSGALYEVSGPTFFGATFNPNAVNVVNAGSLQVSFTNTSSASMSYTVAGQSRTVAIVRQPLGGGTIPGVDYTDLWWNPNESGWGMAMAQQGTNLFLAWYVYDGSGRPMWYVASNCTVSGAGCTGTLYRTTGPPFGPTFNPNSVQAFAVGSATLTFSDANSGTLSYTVDGVSGSKPIMRQLF